MCAVKVAGGKKLDAALARYLDNATLTMRAGILEGSTYPDGLPTALVAFWNEYGATAKVPARQIEIYRKLAPNGEFAKGGKFVKRSQSNYATTHHVDAYTITIPARPFMRTTAESKAARWAQIVGATLKRNGGDFDKALRVAGEAAVRDIKQTIATFTTPPNASSTIAKKGHDQPLRDTKHMMNSVAYDIVNGPVEEE